jgi:hypothetical protein
VTLIHEIVLLAKCLQFLHDSVFLFFESFGYIEYRANGIFSLVSIKMKGLSLIFDFFLFVLLFTMPICVVYNKFKFFDLFTLVLIFDNNVIFKNIVRVKT